MDFGPILQKLVLAHLIIQTARACMARPDLTGGLVITIILVVHFPFLEDMDLCSILGLQEITPIGFQIMAGE